MLSDSDILMRLQVAASIIKQLGPISETRDGEKPLKLAYELLEDCLKKLQVNERV